MSHIAGMIAEEIKANVAVAKAGALLHDIGKALDYEVVGTHVEIGRRILQKFGANEEIIKAMQAHHEEYPYETVESRIVQAADAISGARPGARLPRPSSSRSLLASSSGPSVDRSSGRAPETGSGRLAGYRARSSSWAWALCPPWSFVAPP